MKIYSSLDLVSSDVISSPWRSRTAVERSRVSQDCHYPKGLKCIQLQLVKFKIKSTVSRFDFIVYNDLGRIELVKIIQLEVVINYYTAI